MNYLKELTRQSQTRGSKMHAVVESTSLGHATVRLANRGARLTNLPVLGQFVTAGDKVIVDYSAEGQPIVRPTTVKPPSTPEPGLEIADYIGRETADQLPAIEPPLTEPGHMGVSGRWTSSTNKVYEAYSELGFKYHDLIFDEKIWDTHDAWDPSVNRFYPSEGGIYYIRATVGLVPSGGALDSAKIYFYFTANENGYQSEYRNTVMTKNMLHQDDNGVIVVSSSHLVKTYTTKPTTNGGRIRFAASPTESLTSFYYTFLCLEGEYPILDFVRIAPISSTSVSAIPQWYYE